MLADRLRAFLRLVAITATTAVTGYAVSRALVSERYGLLVVTVLCALPLAYGIVVVVRFVNRLEDWRHTTDMRLGSIEDSRWFGAPVKLRSVSVDPATKPPRGAA